MGTKLHSLVERYIQGVGKVRNEGFLASLRPFNLNYDINKVINTVNYIIGREILEGGYEMIGCEKSYRIKVNPLNYNRLDLLLRRKDKVLVIDWKFSFLSAKDYLKKYQKKINQYLKIAKLHYDCEVEFHLYCIHRHVNREIGFLYKYSMKEVALPVDEVVLSEDAEEFNTGLFLLEEEEDPDEFS